MFIDANIFIASLGRDERARRCQAYLKRVDSGEQNATTSVLVLDEVLHHLAEKYGGHAPSEAAVRHLLEIGHLSILAVNERNLRDALVFFASGLEPHDSLHLAVMKEHGISAILSFDKDFDKLKSVKRMEP